MFPVPTLASPVLTTTSLSSTETIRLTSRQTPHCWLLMAVAELCPARNEGQSLLRRIAARAATVPHRPRPWWSGHGCGQDYRCLLSGLGASLTLHTDSSLTDLLACSNTLPVSILLFIINAILPKIRTSSGLWFNLTLKNLMFSFLAKINDWIQNQSWIFYRWQKLQIYSCFSKSKRLWSMFLAGALDFNSV